MQLSIGALIWLSVRPLISRLWLSGAFGFAITKAHIFPLEASRGTGQIVLNITLPCLMFSKIVPAFTPQNINNLGVLVAVAFIYEAIGLFFAWSVKQFFWVPHRFRYGILCAGTISNYSDIPTAVITSITANIPFNASTDETISVAYVAGFILVFFISLFPMGAHRLVAMDYDGPNVEDEDLRISMASKTKQSMASLVRLLHALPIPGKASANDDAPSDPEKYPSTRTEEKPTGPTSDPASPGFEEKRQHGPAPVLAGSGSGSGSAAVHFHGDESTAAPTEAGPSRAPSPAPKASSQSSSSPLRARVLGITRSAARSFLMPCSVTIVFSIVIAVVTPLKALFTPIPNSPIPNAPDGQPPLSFILD
ncbi:hypothetical protein M0805_006953, partial [Coniferiporia weirii]